MSIGLTTKIAAGIEVGDLIPEVSRALKDILNFSVAPLLTSEWFDVDAARWHPLTGPHHLDVSSPLIGVSIQGEPEMASISIYERAKDRFPESDWEPEELGKRASVGVSGVRTGLSFALVAAVSLAIARRSGGLISDEMRFYSSSFDSFPDEFLRSIRLTSNQNHYRAAAMQFEQQLTRNQARRT